MPWRHQRSIWSVKTSNAMSGGASTNTLALTRSPGSSRPLLARDALGLLAERLHLHAPERLHLAQPGLQVGQRLRLSR